MPAPPRPAGPDAGKTSSGPLAIALVCPKCGAPFEVDDTVVSVCCAHCASLLVLSAPDRAEISIADEVVRGKQDIAEIVISYRVQAERAEIVSKHSDSEGNPPSESFIQRRLAAFDRDLRARVEVIDAHRVQAPYWHLTGALVQAVLGRLGDGPKLVRVRAFEVEHTAPGYDVRAADFRDRGLRLSRSRVRPLTAGIQGAKGPFVPWIRPTGETSREIDKWKGRDLQAGVQAVTRQAEYILARRMLVYRAYWVARVAIEGELKWYLVDGSFASIAGHPDEHEAVALLRQSVPDPLTSTGESYRRVSVTASRCPDCGFDGPLDPAAHVAICSNCHLGLEPRPAGIRLHPYSHAVLAGGGPLDGEFLPFWRYDFQIEMAGAPLLRRLEDYARALFAQSLPPGFAPSGPHLWVPAVRLLGTEFGDETFQKLVHWIHGAALAVEDGKIPLGGAARGWPATLEEKDAREMTAFVLFALHGKASAARLNTMLVTRAIHKAKLTVSQPRLVLVPFSRAADETFVSPGGGVRVAPLLLRRGPELEAHRATVHGAAMAASDRGPWPKMSF
jgi:hypothetical protein